MQSRLNHHKATKTRQYINTNSCNNLPLWMSWCMLVQQLNRPNYHHTRKQMKTCEQITLMPSHKDEDEDEVHT